MIGPRIARRAAAEALGTAFPLAAVVGSGIMAERLSGGNVAVALLANSIATGGALIALILTFGPVSGAQFNPAVTLVLAARGALPWLAAVQNVTAAALTMLSPVRLAMGCALVGRLDLERSVYRQAWLLGAIPLIILVAAVALLIV